MHQNKHKQHIVATVSSKDDRMTYGEKQTKTKTKASPTETYKSEEHLSERISLSLIATHTKMMFTVYYKWSMYLAMQEGIFIFRKMGVIGCGDWIKVHSVKRIETQTL